MFQLDGRLAHAPQIAPSPIGYGNGNPQQLHHGGAKKVIAAQHLGHRASGSPTVAPPARQPVAHAIDDGGVSDATGRSCRELHRRPSSKRRAGRQAATRMDRPDSSPAALFDRRAWRLHRERAAGLGVDFLHREVAERLVDRLDLINHAFAVALDLGSRDGVLIRTLAARGGNTLVVSAEPALSMVSAAPARRVSADPELIPFGDATFNMVASSLLLHWCATCLRSGSTPPRLKARRVAAGGDARRQHAGRAAHRALSRPSSPKKAGGSAHASRQPPNQPTPRRCCSVLVSPCRSPTVRPSPSPIATRWRHARSARDGRDMHCRAPAL